MATKIRFARGGAKKKPFYRIVAADERAPRDGDYIERLGTYNPMLPKGSEERIKYDAERIKYWLSVGAQPTESVARFLRADGLYTVAPKYVAKPKTAKLPPRAQARKDAEEAAKAEAAAKAAEAAAAPAEQEAPAAEAEAPAAE